MRIIGLDCATDDSKIGLSLGEYRPGRLEVSLVETCSPLRPVVSVLVEWLNGASDVLLSIDAPLGWPVPLARALSGHNAGDALMAAPNDMFRRETDRFVQRETGKTPLDIGADRIARTAHAALRILGDLRRATHQPIPLGWSPNALGGIAAIEVYPAATLLAYGFRSSGYKKPNQMEERAEIVSQLSRVLTLPPDTSRMAKNADGLDAVVCLLAAKDFLEGRAMTPVYPDLARAEGWIWASRPGNRAKSRLPSRPVSPPSLPTTGYLASLEREDANVITDVKGLTARDVARRKVLCPACGKKVFASWPAGWDSHAGAICPGVDGNSVEARRSNFKGRFRHLFR